MPVYNERSTYCEVMDQLLSKRIEGVDIEVCVVESNSSDGTREDVLAYHAAISDLSMRVVRMLALSLDLPIDYFAPMFDMPNTTLRLLKYPPQPASAAFNQMGAGAHTDWGGVTAVSEANSPYTRTDLP